MLSEPFARAICEQAISEGRCAEMLECLFNNGSVTIQGGPGGALVLFSGQALSDMCGAANAAPTDPDEGGS